MRSSVDSHYRLWLRSKGEKYTKTVHSLLLLLLLPLCLVPASDPTPLALAPDPAPHDAPALAPAPPAPPAVLSSPAHYAFREILTHLGWFQDFLCADYCVYYQGRYIEQSPAN